MEASRLAISGRTHEVRGALGAFDTYKNRGINTADQIGGRNHYEGDSA